MGARGLDPLKTKYYPFYWSIVESAAMQSVATRHKVGAVVVTPSGMISTGWNGKPAGLPNICETLWSAEKQRYVTDPETVHAERNAIDKMTRQGVPTQGSVLFVSRAPCFECAKALMGLGLAAVYYREKHDDMSGLALLHHAGIHTDHEALNEERYTVRPNMVDSRLADPRGPGFTARSLKDPKYTHPDNL